MLKAAIEKIASMAENQVHEVNGAFYSDRPLTYVEPVKCRPRRIQVSSLESIVKLVKAEAEAVDLLPIFIEVADYGQVNVFTTYDEDFSRNELYLARSDTPNFSFGWKDHESAMIAVRSQFEQGAGTEYLLQLLSRITDESKVSSSDNGVSQTVEVRKGVSLLANEAIRPRVSLRPFRTFMEVEQPESEFLLRIREDGAIGLFEADGGMWKLKAKRTIKAYFEEQLKAFVDSNAVIVMG